MKVNVSTRRQWKDHCVDWVLITMVLGSVIGLVLIYIHR